MEHLMTLKGNCHVVLQSGREFKSLCSFMESVMMLVGWRHFVSSVYRNKEEEEMIVERSFYINQKEDRTQNASLWDTR